MTLIVLNDVENHAIYTPNQVKTKITVAKPFSAFCGIGFKTVIIQEGPKDDEARFDEWIDTVVIPRLELGGILIRYDGRYVNEPNYYLSGGYIEVPNIKAPKAGSN